MPPRQVKPEGYDDIPKEIADPEAEKPEDWDEVRRLSVTPAYHDTCSALGD